MAGTSSIRVRPTTIKAARRWVALLHRRMPRLGQEMWAVALEEDGQTLGVAVVGRPKARAYPQDGRVLEVVRVAVEPGTDCGCSRLYGAVSRAARAMGAEDLLTYTSEDESGTSLRAAGWVPAGMTRCEDWDRKKRPREPGQHVARRMRWWAPWGERGKAARAEATSC